MTSLRNDTNPEASPQSAKAESTQLAKNESSANRSDLELEFLPEYLEILQRPPSSVARYFAITVVIICFAVVAWATLGHIDIIASAPGRLIIGDRSKLIQSPREGEITQIFVTDGQQVRQGEVLIELNSKSSSAERDRLHHQMITMQLEEARIKALLSKNPLENFQPPSGIDAVRVEYARAQLEADHNSYRTRLTQLENEVKHLKLRLELMKVADKSTVALYENAKKRLDGRESLIEEGYLPGLEILELQREVIERQRDVEQNQSSQAEIDSEIIKLQDQIRQLKAENQKTLLDTLTETRTRLFDLQKKLIQAAEQNRMMSILSPVDGVVQQLNVSTLGGVVRMAQELMVVVPEDGKLVAEVNILNKDIGFVQPGQLVEIKLDSFPYTKYGTIRGEILHVSKDAAEDPDLGLVYPARVKLSRDVIEIEGEAVELTAGMSLTAEVKTGDRRIISYVLSPLQEYQSESLKER